MNSKFSVNDLIYRANKRRSDSGESSKAQDYGEILDKLQRLIAKHHSAELAEVLYSKEAEGKLKDLIMRYLNQEQLVAKDLRNISELVDAVYYDMAGMGLLSPYLQDADTEEINIDGSGGVWVLYRDKKIRLKETFSNAEACANIVRKMSRFGNVILDGSKPLGDSFIAKGIRMSGAITPCVDPDAGAIASIRKQKPLLITRENLIEWETATPDELDFLTMCVNHGVSIGIAGATGSGKTADMGYILSCVPEAKRIVTIEDTRELSLARYDENGVMINDVVHLLTKEEPNPVTMLDLLKLSLRLHPEILVPAEMRGKEALTVQEAGRTGHTVVSTLHANSARTAYDRILTMCLEAGTSLSEERLLKNIVEAFPVMVFKRQLPDKSRKYMEVFEATGVQNGEVTGSTLYQYVVDHYERDKEGRITRVVGSHRHMGNISPALAERLLIGGVPEREIRRFMEGGAA
ncbi:Type IV secretion system protein PtlH [Pelotomaculum schinkii]|uniref:Type IV secretion system protein PtlH n=1 Tax=Pelotomaculum schinkii TaxID=78350 RepID=A0A4Y7R9J7_9FIRM|nr:ATPase, T2SS/T4P/T4SS family [Pelotomaculum schinkii]TEB05625.1 Type IV secretion system protein PtlH [Pelotomaculum schinkii]